jgi:hypothetical protein
LWLDDNPNSPENSRIRRSIPGHSSSKAVEGLGDDRLSLAADNRDIALKTELMSRCSPLWMLSTSF